MITSSALESDCGLLGRQCIICPSSESRGRGAGWSLWRFMAPSWALIASSTLGSLGRPMGSCDQCGGAPTGGADQTAVHWNTLGRQMVSGNTPRKDTQTKTKTKAARLMQRVGTLTWLSQREREILLPCVRTGNKKPSSMLNLFAFLHHLKSLPWLKWHLLYSLGLYFQFAKIKWILSWQVHASNYFTSTQDIRATFTLTGQSQRLNWLSTNLPLRSSILAILADFGSTIPRSKLHHHDPSYITSEWWEWGSRKSTNDWK